jgi:phage terminase large subunit-like protein
MRARLLGMVGQGSVAWAGLERAAVWGRMHTDRRRARSIARSPDRVDALVWAVMELTAKPAVKPAAWMA